MEVGPTLKKLREMYPNDVKVVYKYFIINNGSLYAATASCAANHQGKFEAMEDLIWEKGVKQRNLDKEKMIELAKELRLDMAKFTADLESEECVEWIRSSQQELGAVGTNGTPAFYINGRYLSGAQSLPAFKRVVDEELAKANKAIDGGVALASYYQTAVVKNGLKKLEAPNDGDADPHAGHDH